MQFYGKTLEANPCAGILLDDAVGCCHSLSWICS
jgi:hypothetical protein